MGEKERKKERKNERKKEKFYANEWNKKRMILPVDSSMKIENSNFTKKVSGTHTC